MASARNALLNYNGFSPNQVIFGFNLAMRDVFHSNPPALESVALSEIVRMNLIALHSARREFQKCESSERKRRALRSNIREIKTFTLRNGDKDFYKRNNSKGWHGPGVKGVMAVVCHSGKLAVVCHSGTYV